MRRLALLPLLLAALFFGACDDLTGPGRRSLDGEWSTRIDGEEVWVSLRDDGGEIRGSGEWGFDDIFITGERNDTDVYLIFEFDGFNPIELEGEIVSREIEGRLYGSGFGGERVRFRRD
jgi:hypothetical protein